MAVVVKNQWSVRDLFHPSRGAAKTRDALTNLLFSQTKLLRRQSDKLRVKFIMLAEGVGNFASVNEKSFPRDFFYKILKDLGIFRLAFEKIWMIKLDIGQDDAERRVVFQFIFV